jgi:hypothetical protein
MGGPIHLNGSMIYAFVVTKGDDLRVRVSADDLERLGLVAGQQVKVNGPGRDAETRLLARVEEIPPLVWLVFSPLSARRAG